MLVVSALITAVEKIPVGCADVGPAAPAERDAGVGDLAALLPDLLALFLRQASQEILEAAPGSSGHGAGGYGRADGRGRLVDPVKLHSVAQHQSGVFARGHIVGRSEQQVERGLLLLLAPGQQRFHQCASGNCVPRQQTRSRHRREGNGSERLRVISQSVLLVGIGPGPVEDIFAVRMVLQIQRADRLQFAAAPQADEARRPAGCRRGAAALFHGRQILVTHKRSGRVLRIQQRVPLRRRDRKGRFQYPDDIIVRVVYHCCHGPQTLYCPTQFPGRRHAGQCAEDHRGGSHRLRARCAVAAHTRAVDLRLCGRGSVPAASLHCSLR